MSVEDQETQTITPAMFRCTACGAEPVGVVDTLVCRWMTGRDGSIIDWDGNDLDTQASYCRQGLPVLICANGHDYTHWRFTAEVLSTLHVEGSDDGHDPR